MKSLRILFMAILKWPVHLREAQMTLKNICFKPNSAIFLPDIAKSSQIISVGDDKLNWPLHFPHMRWKVKVKVVSNELGNTRLFLHSKCFTTDSSFSRFQPTLNSYWSQNNCYPPPEQASQYQQCIYSTTFQTMPNFNALKYGASIIVLGEVWSNIIEGITVEKDGLTLSPLLSHKQKSVFSSTETSHSSLIVVSMSL